MDACASSPLAPAVAAVRAVGGSPARAEAAPMAVTVRGTEDCHYHSLGGARAAALQAAGCEGQTGAWRALEAGSRAMGKWRSAATDARSEKRR